MPATNLPAFARRAGTPLTVKGSVSTKASVSSTAWRSTAEGGDIVEGLRKGARMEEWDSIMFDRICNYPSKGG